MGRNKKRVKWFPTKPFRWSPNRFFKGLFPLLDWSLPKALSISIGIWGGWHSTRPTVGAQLPFAWRGSSWADRCSWSGGHSRAFSPPPCRWSFILQTSKYGNAASEQAGRRAQAEQLTPSCHFIDIPLCFLTELLSVVRFGAGRVQAEEAGPSP